MQLNILIIESQKEDALFYKKLLEKSPLFFQDYSILFAHSLSEAVALLQKSHFHLILSNLYLSDSKGMDTYDKLHKLAPTIPIVILTEETEESLALAAITKGAQDYISKSEIHVKFFSRILRFALERHEQQLLLREQSFTDPLTGIYNRRGFIALAEQQIELSRRLYQGFFLFLIDLDHLKDVNDTYGHQEGDKMIARAAEIFKQAFRNSDIIGRIGGDEFAILALSTGFQNEQTLVTHLSQALEEYNKTRLHPYVLSFSVGEVFFDPLHDMTLEELFHVADICLYENKKLHHRASSK